MNERERLTRLLGQLQRLSDGHWHILDQPCRAMEDKAWVGPSGRRFDGDVHRNARILRNELQEAIELVRAKLDHTPQGVR
ncbi:hypothetical protein [Actinomadura sp. HBU206391]|uniref:hypothetical protein n=1 Tax=Actinomadura sp. HBU206391 TaxID=2731692 RepID=UPI0016507965|nr:hypothetical protein [Actinomadura sp. HBU206391]MBC6463108.1 hypothetical protein [Actinomadura sp. HBU206391]